MKNNDEYGNPNDKKYDPLILKAIIHKYKGVRNEFIEKEFNQIANKKVEVTGQIENFEKCPCNTRCTTRFRPGRTDHHFPVEIARRRPQFLEFGCCYIAWPPSPQWVLKKKNEMELKWNENPVRYKISRKNLLSYLAHVVPVPNDRPNKTMRDGSTGS